MKLYSYVFACIIVKIGKKARTQKRENFFRREIFATNLAKHEITQIFDIWTNFAFRNRGKRESHKFDWATPISLCSRMVDTYGMMSITRICYYLHGKLMHPVPSPNGVGVAVYKAREDTLATYVNNLAQIVRMPESYLVIWPDITYDTITITLITISVITFIGESN